MRDSRRRLDHAFTIYSVDGDGLDKTSIEIVREWLKTNARGFRFIWAPPGSRRWLSPGKAKIYLARDNEAVLFKLRWSQDLEPRKAFSGWMPALGANTQIRFLPDHYLTHYTEYYPCYESKSYSMRNLSQKPTLQTSATIVRMATTLQLQPMHQKTALMTGMSLNSSIEMATKRSGS